MKNKFEIFLNRGGKGVERPEWLMEEAAVLLQSLFWVMENWVERSEAIAEVSDILRKYGRAIGREVDDTYRNVAGITCQMDTLEYILTGDKTSQVNLLKWHKDIILLHKLHPDKFHELIQSVSKKLAEKELQVAGDNDMDSDLKLSSKGDLVGQQATETSELSVAEKSRDYHVTIEKTGNSDLLSCSNKRRDLVRLDFKNYTFFLGTYPVDCKIAGEKIEATTWSDFFVKVIELFLKKFSIRMKDLYQYPLYGRSIDPFFMKNEIEGRFCQKLHNGYWINCNYNTPAKLKRIVKLCLFCGVRRDQILLYGAKKSKNFNSTRRDKSHLTGQLGERKLSKLKEDVDTYLRSRDLAGATAEEVQQALAKNETVAKVSYLLDQDLNVVAMPGDRFVHVACFIGLDEARAGMAQILRQHFIQFDGYSNHALLYGAAQTELQMFLNDNDCENEDSVYALAEYFFSKCTSDDKAYVFKRGHIFREQWDVPASVFGLMIRLARQNDGLLTQAEGERFLECAKLPNMNLRQQLKIRDDKTFLLYCSQEYLLSEKLGIDDSFCKIIHDKLEGLFHEADVDYVIPRDIRSTWFSSLPQLPHDLPWTILLLQEVIKKFPAIGFSLITSNLNQSLDTIAAAFVPDISELQTMADVVSLYLVEHASETIGQRMEAERLREILCKSGMISGKELIFNMNKVLNDYRFAWTNDGKMVRFSGAI